ncbi:MAG: hypothetical protein VYE22_35345 [Myxococcota bacterium]|nr:hypothetical protein [Myxococcota bacterium]
MPEVLISGYLHTRSESAARRILDRLGRACGLDLRAASLTPRPGQPGEVGFLLTVPWAETTARGAWFDLPARFASVVGRWSTPGPPVETEGRWDFALTSERTSLPGLICLTVEARST